MVRVMQQNVHQVMRNWQKNTKTILLEKFPLSDEANKSSLFLQ